MEEIKEDEIRDAVLEDAGSIEFVQGETMLPSLFNSIFVDSKRPFSLDSVQYINEDEFPDVP